MFEESNKILEDARKHRYMAYSEKQRAIVAESMYISALVKDAKILEGSWFVTNDSEDGHIKFYHCLTISPRKRIPWGSDSADNYFTDRLSIVYDAIGGVYDNGGGYVWHVQHDGNITPSELRQAEQMTWEQIKKTYNVTKEMNG